jgi:hypothetical protein
MNTQAEFFEHLVRLLKDAEIRFMVSGSLASSIYGPPRATNDFDMVIDPIANSLNRLIDSLPNDWYASREAVMSALQHHSMFNIVDSTGGWKADLIIRKDRPFSLSEFSRSRPGFILQSEVPVVSIEDSILSKLEWSAESNSQRQYQDALGVARLNAASLDLEYLRHWAAELKVGKLLEKLLAEANASSRSV